MIRILIADDHQIVREGLKGAFRQQGTDEMTIAAEAADFKEALAILSDPSNRIDVAVIDLEMPEGSPQNLIAQMKARGIDIPVIILSAYKEAVFAVRMYQAGALGYLSKGNSTQEILNAVHVVYRRNRYIPPSLRDQFEDMLGGMKPLHDQLTKREFEIFQMILQGLSGVEIAELCNRDRRVVTEHKRNIKEKLNLRNDMEMYCYGLVHNLINGKPENLDCVESERVLDSKKKS